VGGDETLDDVELVTEAVMFGLRSRVGIDLDRIRERWRVDLAGLNGDLFARWAEEGLVEGTRVLRPTARGMAIADRLAADVSST